MNRLNKMVKTALVALFAMTLPVAVSADHQRTPNPSPVVKTSGMSKKAVALFRKAFATHSDANNTITGTPTSFNTKQLVNHRPGKIFKSADAPVGDFYALVPFHSRSTGYENGYYGKLHLDNLTLTQDIVNSQICNGAEYYFQTGAERKGILYIPAYTQDMVTFDITVYWKAFDVETGNQLPDLVFEDQDSSLMAFLYGMTYDPVHDLFYGLSIDINSGQYGTLVKIDPKQAVMTPKPVANVGSSQGEAVSCIAYNPNDQMLYGLTDGGVMMMLDINSDVFDMIPVKEYDSFSEYYMFPENSSANALCYSPRDHAFYFVYRDSFEQRMVLAAIEDENYEAYEIGDITPLGYICQLVCRDSYAADDAPDLMADPVLAFDKADLTGTYTLHTPSTTFAGVALHNDITVHVLLDGEEIETFTAKPDTDYTKSLTTATGQHTLEVYSSIGDFDSPLTSVIFYTGYDSTLPPTDLKLDGALLTWTAPAGAGAHNGYVDTDDITYNVYFNGEKINLSPISDTHFKFAQPDKMERKAITVTAVTRGMESEPSLPISRTVGVALELPFSCEPANASEAALFETYNADGDENVFQFYTDWKDFNCFTIRTGRYTEMPNDWLFLPALAFENADDLYQLTVKYANTFMDERHKDNLDIYIGTNPNPQSMTQKLYSHTDRTASSVSDINVRFAVPEAGDYVIGFHTYPGAGAQFRGILLYDFDVRKCEDASSNAPATPTDVKLVADHDGQLDIEVSFKAPTTSLSGNELDKNTDITVIARTDAGSASTTLKPGQEGKVTVPASIDGLCDVYLSSKSEDGVSTEDYYRTYVGLDTPLPPSNVRYTIDRDNLGLTITWDAPVGGQHGGYINFNNLKYAIYSAGGAGNYTKIADVTGNEYHYTTNPAAQSFHHVGPVVSNEMGSSVNGQFVYESLGTPYQAPMVEEWDNSGFSYSKWTFSSDGEFAGSDIQSVSSGIGLGIGDPTFTRGGGLVAINTGTMRNARYEIIAPRVTTEDINFAKVGVRVWDYPNCGSVELWARSADQQEYKKIATLDLPHSAEQWLEIETPLPAEYINQPWVQVNLRGDIPGDGYVLFDNYSFAQDIDTDFTVISLDGPSMTTVGETAKFDVVIANSGDEPASTTLIVDILGDGKVITSDTKAVGRTLSGETFEYSASFDITVDYLRYKQLTARVTISDEADQNPNNNVLTMDFVVNDHALPIVSDLAVARDGQNVVLTWSEPDTSYGSPESFEVMPSFSSAEQLGLWTNLDGDKGGPFAIDGMRFDGDDQPCAWTVWDASAMNCMSDPRLSPHSGRRTLLARSIGYNEASDQPVKSFDWLISPEIVPGTTVSFWYNTLSSSYTETIELWVSYTDNKVDFDNIEYDAAGNPIKCGSFIKLRNFTKSGSETWEFCKTGELTNVKYFAFVYGSIGQFGAMIDDVIFTPANSYNWEIDSYEVARKLNNGKVELIATDIKELTFTDLNDALNSTYWVRSVVVIDGVSYRSPYSNEVHIEGSSVEQLGADVRIEGGNACVIITGLNGNTVDIFDADGRHLGSTRITADRQSVSAPAGVVIVKAGETYTKVMVK